MIKIAGLEYDSIPAADDEIVIRWGNDGLLVSVTVQRISPDGASAVIAFEQSNPTKDEQIRSALERKERLAQSAFRYWRSKGHEVTALPI